MVDSLAGGTEREQGGGKGERQWVARGHGRGLRDARTWRGDQELQEGGAGVHGIEAGSQCAHK